MATIQAMLGSSILHDLSRRSLVITHRDLHLKRTEYANPLLRVTLPHCPIRKSIQISCKAASSTAPKDAWENAVSQPDTFSQYSGYIAAASMEEADQLDEYNAEKIAAVFKKKPFLLARRLLQIAGTLGSWAAVRYMDSVLGKYDTKFKERAGQLRGALVQLGPAFVKIAQAVSSRPDVIAPEYLTELALLQDRISPFSTELALNIIEQELGVPVEQLFTEISPQPIAAASLGQVYQARLRPNGQPVAVKVQRPGVRAAMALDLFILRKLAGTVGSILRLNTDLPGVVDEWASSLFKEMDYQAEARNGIRFRKLFGALPDVLIPKMYSELTSRRVLVMEWLEGQRLSDVSDLRLVEVGVYCSLTQLLDSGFYHADPHPGNLMRTPDGKLAYLDFGMMGEMKENLRDGLIEASLHLVNREYDALASDFVTLGLLPPTAEMGELSKALTGVFQEAVSKGVRNISFGDLSGKLGVTMYRFKFRIPSYFSLVIRSGQSDREGPTPHFLNALLHVLRMAIFQQFLQDILTVLEGIALSSDPNYKVLSSSYPWIARKVLSDKSPKLRSTLRELLYKDGSFRIDRLQSLMTESMRQPMEEPAVLANKPAESQEVKMEKDSRSLVKRILNFTLTEQGDFVREMILDELAKPFPDKEEQDFLLASLGFLKYPDCAFLDGVDALNRVAFDAAAHTLRTRFPIGLPEIAPLTEDEDLKHLENLKQLINLLTSPGTSSGVGTVAGMGMGKESGANLGTPTNFKTSTQVSRTNSNDLVQTTKVENSENQNGALKKTNIVASDNKNDMIQRTEVVNNANRSNGVARTEVVVGANSKDLIEKTEFVKAGDSNGTESALSWDEITALLQRLSSLSKYLPLLAVVPELPLPVQQQAVFLPADLAGRVASRVLARTIRGSIPRNGGRYSSAKSDYENY